LSLSQDTEWDRAKAQLGAALVNQVIKATTVFLSPKKKHPKATNQRFPKRTSMSADESFQASE